MKSFKTVNKESITRHICKVASKYDDSSSTKAYAASYSKNNRDGSSSCVIIGPHAISPEEKAQCSYRIVDNDVVLNVGDIVLFEENGLGTVIFDKNSLSNSLFLTDTCNSRCIMCPQPSRSYDSCDYIEMAMQTIDLIDPDTKALGITGGEPTLAWDGLIKVLHRCQESISDLSIELLTNGRILKDYSKAKKLYDVAGQNLTLCIPIYADTSILHDSIVNAKGAFWETIEGIYNAERLGIKVEIRNVISKINYKRLPQWSEYIYRNIPFVSHIALMGMEPVGLALNNIRKLWIDPLDYIEDLNKSINILNQRDMNISIYNHQLCTLPTGLWSYSRKSISEWKNIFMSECMGCSVMHECGGFFKSSVKIKSRGIKIIP